MTLEGAGAPRAPHRSPLARRRETRISAGPYAPARIALAALLGYLAVLALASSSGVSARPTSSARELSAPSSTFDPGQLPSPYPQP